MHSNKSTDRHNISTDRHNNSTDRHLIDKTDYNNPNVKPKPQKRVKFEEDVIVENDKKSERKKT